MAPEEELPEAAPAVTDTVEDAAAGGLVNSAGESSGGKKIVSAVEEGRGLVGAGGAAAAPSIGELGPEREVAGLTAETGEKDGREAEIVDTAKTENEENEEEEEYVFQFGTVNLSDEDAAGEDAGLVVAQDTGPEARHSPERFRYRDTSVMEERDEAALATAAQPGPGGGEPASPSAADDDTGARCCDEGDHGGAAESGNDMGYESGG